MTIGERPSCKTERHYVACYRLVLKRSLLELLRLFCGGVGELYTDKAIAHHHIHAYNRDKLTLSFSL
ncbi:hypothetical protein [Bartonella rattaustraliani]|uniref:hypothetical protein n=1 Tax=Bartonella rattaustraliani TaxID=481139 RepID=UPI0012E9BCE1|nr:hypothetical protein [Bartonella rattaustraliani]